MNWDEIEGKGSGLHYHALRQLRKRFNRGGGPASAFADDGQFGERRRKLTDAEVTTNNGERDEVAEVPRLYPTDSLRGHGRGGRRGR